MLHKLDISGKTWLCGGEPEPVINFDTKQPKLDENGQPLFAYPLIVIEATGTDVITVRLAGAVKAVVVGSPVTVKDVVAYPWSMGTRSGVSYRAGSIEPVTRAATTETR